MQTFDTISMRASLKNHISTRNIEQDKIIKILDAARLAPSARNTQPWFFIVVQDKKVIQALVDSAFTITNQIAKEAPVIIVVCARPGDDVVVAGKEYYLFDAGLAVENMVLAATELGLITHLMAGIRESQVKSILHFPDDIRFVIATPLAYPAEASYEESARDRLSQRSRKSLKDIVYFNKWGETTSL